MVESRRAVPGDAFGMTEIYIDSWNEGFGHLIGFRNLEPERVERAIVWTPANHPRGRSFYRATGWQPLHQSRANGAEIAFGRAL
jgi:hypothetical protein